MAGGRFSKNAIYSGNKYWNSPFYDAAPGGQITNAPAGLVVSQGEQTLPGDRTIFGPLDALVYSNTTANLYTGTYRYVQFRNNSTSSPTRGHAAYWDIVPPGYTGSTPQADAQYGVTSDEPASALFAGVFINTPAAGGNNSWWWIQESGKCSCKSRTALSTTGAVGAGVYLYRGGNNSNAADVGTFDTSPIIGANNGNGTTIDAALTNYVGQQETAATNNNVTLVDIGFSRSYRW